MFSFAPSRVTRGGRRVRLAIGLGALSLAAIPAPAGAATFTTSAIPLTCTAVGNTVTIDATVTTIAPASLGPGASFTPTAQIGLTLPSSLYSTLSGLGISTVTVSLKAFPVDAAGATPASLNWFSSTPPGVTVSTTGSPGVIEIPSTPLSVGPYTVTGASGSSVGLTLDSGTNGIVASAVAGGLTIAIDCTAPSPAPTVASIPIVAPPPTVTAVQPTTGPTTGGNLVTVDGTGFAAGDTVDFGPQNPGSNPTVAFGGDSLTVTAPRGAAGKVDVTVTDPTTGTSAPSSADAYTYVVPPCSAAPVIVTQPASQSVTAPAAATFTAAGSTPANCAAPTVQWESEAPGASSFTPVSGATSTTLSTGATTVAESGTRYEAVFSNAFGSTTTNAATLTVVAPACSAAPVIVTQPASQSVTAPAAATFSAAGSTPANCAAPTVQWESEAPGASSFTPVSGATSTTLSTGATTVAESGTRYEAVFSNAFGSTTTSAATLTVVAPACSAAPVIVTQPASQSVTAPAAATFSAAGSTPANCAAPTVQWESEAPGASSFTPVSGATSDSYTTPATTAGESGTRYEAVFSNAFGSTTTSAATLTVGAPACSAAPVIVTQPASQSVTAPAATTFTAAGSTPANCTAPTVQWESEAPGASSFTPISGATSTTLSTGPTTAGQSGTRYEAVFSNAFGSTTTSAATLTVGAPACSAAPVIVTQPASQAVTAPTAATFSAAGSTPANCAAPTVQWESEAPGASSFTPISGATSTTLSTGPTFIAESGTKYEAVFSNAFGSTTTNAATLTVGAPPCSAAPVIVTQPATQAVTAPTAATFTAAGSTPTNCAAPTVQWESEAPGASSFTPISGAASTTLSTGPTTVSESGTEYEAVFTNGFGSTTTSAATLTVGAPACSAAPVIVTQPASQSVTAPAAATFSAAGSTPANCAAPTVRWESEAPGASSFTPISGATSTAVSTGATNVSESGTEYEAVFTNGFGSTTTNVATLTVSPPPSCSAAPTITTQPASVTVTAAAAATFSAAGSTPANCAAPTVQWESEAPGASSFTPISGATATTVSTGATTVSESGMKYEAVFTNGFGSTTTNVATLTVNPPTTTQVPVVSHVSPSSGYPFSAVFVCGNNFSRVTAVSFGAQPAFFLAVERSCVIALVPPARTSGPVDITVTNRYGTSATTSADRFTYLGRSFGGFFG